MQFIGDTGSYQITKGSSLLITIPITFDIYSFSVASSSCVAVSGFSDEISCVLTGSPSGGYLLQVLSGFSSQAFTGGQFAFNISEIRNPKNSKPTDSFAFRVLDSAGNEEFVFSQILQLQMVPQPFEFAVVSSSSPVNGQSALYTFTLTFSVDTPIGSYIQVTLPSEVTLDSSKPLVCQGVLNLNKTFGGGCVLKNDRVFVFAIGSDKYNVTQIGNGTSVSFQLGYFFNPVSSEQSGPFQVQTFETSSSNTQYYYINQDLEDVRIQNSQDGFIQNFSVTQYGTQLNSATAIRVAFQTENAIPQGSVVVLTVPNSMQTNDTKGLEVTLNGGKA